MTKNQLIPALLFSIFLLSNCKKDEAILPEPTQYNSIDNSEKVIDTDSVPQSNGLLDTNSVASGIVTDTITQSIAVPVQSLSTAPAIPASAYDISKSLPVGFVTDGSVDYTTYIQDAIKKYTELVLE